jgi:hypothetical protein
MLCSPLSIGALGSGDATTRSSVPLLTSAGGIARPSSKVFRFSEFARLVDGQHSCFANGCLHRVAPTTRPIRLRRANGHTFEPSFKRRTAVTTRSEDAPLEDALGRRVSENRTIVVIDPDSSCSESLCPRLIKLILWAGTGLAADTRDAGLRKSSGDRKKVKEAVR